VTRCAAGHYTMRGVIKVVTHEQYVLWLAGQKSNYDQVMTGKAPPGGATVDSTKATTMIR